MKEVRRNLKKGMFDVVAVKKQRHETMRGIHATNHSYRESTCINKHAKIFADNHFKVEHIFE